MYTNLTDWITRIADYIFRNEDTARKGIAHIMRGKVLKLKSEEIREEAQKEIAISFSKMGLPIEQIAQGITVDEKMIREWLAEKQSGK